MTRILRYLLIVGGAIMGILLFLLASASDNSSFFDEHYPWLLGLNVLVALALLAVLAAPCQPAQTAPGASGWTLACVDCPRDFRQPQARSLRLDATGHPHIAYGGDHLYYASYDGAAWQVEVADSQEMVTPPGRPRKPPCRGQVAPGAVLTITSTLNQSKSIERGASSQRSRPHSPHPMLR